MSNLPTRATTTSADRTNGHTRDIFHKVAFKSLTKSKTRTIVTIIGVILSTAMITAVATFVLSLQSYLLNGAINKYGDWHLQYFHADPDFTDELRNNGAVQNVSVADDIGYAQLPDSQNPDKPYLYLSGFNADTFDTIPLTLTSGRLPENDTEVIVPSHLESNGGIYYTVGDTLSLEIGKRIFQGSVLSQNDSLQHDDSESEALTDTVNRTFTVVGTYLRPRFEGYTAPGYTLITYRSTVSASVNLFVTLKHPLTINSFIKKTTTGHPYSMNDDVLRFMGISSDRWINILLYAIGTVLVALVMLGSVFLIYNSFNISLNERTKQIGVLESVGATAKQIRTSVLFEGFCIGCISIPLGILVGIGSIALVIRVVAGTFGSVLYQAVPLSLSISPLPLIAAAVISLITILISAYLPAHKAAATPIMDCIRETGEVKMSTRDVQIAKWMQKLLSLEGTLALKNFKRNKRRYRSIVLSLVLSVVLFVNASAFVSNLKRITTRVNVFTTYDIGLETSSLDDEQMASLFDTLKDADLAANPSYQSFITCYCPVGRNELTDACQQVLDNSVTEYPVLTRAVSEDSYMIPMNIQFLEDTFYQSFIESLGLLRDDYPELDKKMIVVAMVQDPTKTASDDDEYTDMFVSDSLQTTLVSEANGEPVPEQKHDVSLTFLNTVLPDTLPLTGKNMPKSYIFQAILPYSAKASYQVSEPHFEVKGMTFTSANPGKTVKGMERLLRTSGLTENQYHLYNMYEMLDESRNLIFIVNVFAYTFILMISLIAIANVFNTISTNIKFRRRELAMLRSVGMSDRSFTKMMNFECAFYGLRTLLFGLPIAGVFSYLIYNVIATAEQTDMKYHLPLVSMIISIIGVFTIVFITMLYSVNQIKKENIIEALRDDMT